MAHSESPLTTVYEMVGGGTALPLGWGNDHRRARGIGDAVLALFAAGRRSQAASGKQAIAAAHVASVARGVTGHRQGVEPVCAAVRAHVDHVVLGGAANVFVTDRLVGGQQLDELRVVEQGAVETPRCWGTSAARSIRRRTSTYTGYQILENTIHRSMASDHGRGHGAQRRELVQQVFWVAPCAANACAVQ